MGTNGAEAAMNRWLGYPFKFNFPLKFSWIACHIQWAASSRMGASDVLAKQIFRMNRAITRIKSLIGDYAVYNSESREVAPTLTSSSRLVQRFRPSQAASWRELTSTEPRCPKR